MFDEIIESLEAHRDELVDWLNLFDGVRGMGAEVKLCRSALTRITNATISLKKVNELLHE